MDDETRAGELDRFLSEDCPECGTPGLSRHLSAVGGCGTCAASDPRPVVVTVRNPGWLAYDMTIPKWPDAPPWTPFRDVFARWAAAKVCYSLPSGNMVHVRPGCRC